MLNRAPSVYVPVEPEDNTLTLPIVLSVIVHVALLAFIIFSHRVPNLDDKQPIETSIVTPEELATLQAGIKANRETGSTQGGSNPPDISAYSQPAPSNDNDNSASRQTSSNQESVLSRGLSSVFGSTPDSDITQAPVQDSVDNEPVFEEISRPDSLSESENNPEPTQVAEDTPDDSAAKKSSEGKSATNKPGQVSEQFPVTPANGKGSTGGSTKSKGQIASDLKNYIEPKWNPDQKFVGTKITASITVDDNGNVLSVTTNAKDSVLGESLIAAIKQASPLTPIAGSGYTKLESVFIVTKK